MGRTANRLTTLQIEAIRKAGRYSDGDNLYVAVSPPRSDDEAPAKRWVFLFRHQGRSREMGLGSYKSDKARGRGLTLKEARSEADKANKALDAGLDPIEARRADAAIPSFGAMADAVFETVKAESRSDKHIAGWERSLTVHAASLRDLPVNEIAVAHVLRVLTPLWGKLPETARRVRGRIERVLDAAAAKGHRSGTNPALWRGNLQHLLARRKKLARGHHRALPYQDVPEFMADLRGREAVAALALEFAVLNASRTSEVIGAAWSELKREAKLWTVPGGRMKGGKEHRVPLAPASIAVLDKMAGGETWPTSGYVFPGPKKRGSSDARTLSTNVFRALLLRMKVASTAHGFRSSFRDWCGEASTFPRELAELSLAHVFGDDTERAYRRGDALERRRKLLEAWSNYCSRPAAGNVRHLARPGAK